MSWEIRLHLPWMSLISMLKHSNTHMVPRTPTSTVESKVSFQPLKTTQEKLKTNPWTTKLVHQWRWLKPKRGLLTSRSFLQKLVASTDLPNWQRSTQLFRKSRLNQVSRSVESTSLLPYTRKDVFWSQVSPMPRSWAPYTQLQVSSKSTLGTIRGSEMPDWWDSQWGLTKPLVISIVRLRTRINSTKFREWRK